MAKKASLTGNSMQYGAITGLLLFIVFVVLNVLRITQSFIPQVITYGIIIMGIIFGTKNLRDNVRGGKLSYGTGLGSGTLISMFCAILIAFFMFIYLKFFDASMIDTILQNQEKTLLERGYTDEQIETAMNYTRKFSTPAMISIISVFTYTFMGFLFSLVIAAFLKRESKDFKEYLDQQK